MGSSRLTLAPEIKERGDAEASMATKVFVLTVFRLNTLSVKNAGETSHLKVQISKDSSTANLLIACRSFSCALFTPLEYLREKQPRQNH